MFAIFLMLLVPVAGADTTTAEGADTDSLAPMAGLLEACWEGVSSKRGEPRDVQCYRRVGASAVISQHVVYSDPLYCGETRYTAGPNGIGYVYTNSVGGRSEGTVTEAKQGLDFPDERYVGNDGEVGFFATELRFAPSGDFMKTTYALKGADGQGKRKRISRMMFTKIPDPVALGPAGYRFCRGS